MLALCEAGAVVMPPMLTYYNHPKSLHDATTHIMGKILNEFDLEMKSFRRWGPRECVASLRALS